MEERQEEQKPHILRRGAFLWLLLISFSAFTICSYAAANGSYQAYAKELNIIREPALTLFFRGLHDGIYPWSMHSRTEPVHETKAASAFFFRIGEPVLEEPVMEEAEEVETETVVEAAEETEAAEEPVSTWGTAPAGYFSDALFVGDSRTDGLAMYSSLNQEADFLSKTSLSIYNLTEWTLFYRTPGADKREMKFADLLSEKQYGKIYLSVGINELGTGIDNYTGAFRQVIEEVKTLQPEADIYVEAIMDVTAAKSASDATINNQRIAERNEMLMLLADEEAVYYIDMNPSVTDEAGNLLPEITNDGVHLKANEYERWVAYLKDNVMIKKG